MSRFTLLVTLDQATLARNTGTTTASPRNLSMVFIISTWSIMARLLPSGTAVLITFPEVAAPILTHNLLPYPNEVIYEYPGKVLTSFFFYRYYT
jgi:hypothetical protein